MKIQWYRLLSVAGVLLSGLLSWAMIYLWVTSVGGGR